MTTVGLSLSKIKAIAVTPSITKGTVSDDSKTSSFNVGNINVKLVKPCGTVIVPLSRLIATSLDDNCP